MGWEGEGFAVPAGTKQPLCLGGLGFGVPIRGLSWGHLRQPTSLASQPATPRDPERGAAGPAARGSQEALPSGRMWQLLAVGTGALGGVHAASCLSLRVGPRPMAPFVEHLFCATLGAGTSFLSSLHNRPVKDCKAGVP